MSFVVVYIFYFSNSKSYNISIIHSLSYKMYNFLIFKKIETNIPVYPTNTKHNEYINNYSPHMTRRQT